MEKMSRLQKSLIKVSSITGEGFDDLEIEIEKFIELIKNTDLLKQREERRNKRRIRNDILRSVDEILDNISGDLQKMKLNLINKLCEKYK